MFLQKNVKKSGKNKFANYEYFELSDIVPAKVEIFNELGLCDLVTFTNEAAILTLFCINDPTQKIEFVSPMRDLEVKGANALQSLGGVETYQRRYLYMMMLDIVEADMFDGTQGAPEKPTVLAKKKSESATPPFVTGDATVTQSSAKDLIAEISSFGAKLKPEERTATAEIIKKATGGSVSFRNIKDVAVLSKILNDLKEAFPNA